MVVETLHMCLFHLLSGDSTAVFEKEYHLMPLDSLEAYLSVNKHLPDIPCNNEITKNGLNLGEFNGLLLKKVEELYLYIIEQNKEINELQNSFFRIQQK